MLIYPGRDFVRFKSFYLDYFRIIQAPMQTAAHYGVRDHKYAVINETFMRKE